MVAQSQARRPHSAPSLMPATASVVSLLVRGAMVGSSHSATAHDVCGSSSVHALPPPVAWAHHDGDTHEISRHIDASRYEHIDASR